MNAKIVGGGIVVVAVVAAGVYFGFLNTGGGNDEALARERADKMFTSLKAKGGAVTYKSASASGRKLVLTDVVLTSKDPSGKPFVITFGEMRVNDLDWDHAAQPAYADIEYRAMRIPAIKDSAEFKEFAGVTGTSDIVIHSKAAYRYDAATKMGDLTSSVSEIEGFGTLTITGKIEGFNPAEFENMTGTPDTAKLMGMVAAMRLHGLSIAFKDAGGTAKLLKFAAHKAKKTEEDTRQEALAGLAKAKTAPFRLAREGAAAAESFLKSPGTIAIEAKPKTPFAFMQVMAIAGKFDPAVIDKLSDDLGLTVTAK